jgi:hypothetical protein
MRTFRNHDDSKRRRVSTAPLTESRTQSFTCSAELLRAFEHRALELGCSFDWLLEEAMQRLLVEGSDLEDSDLATDDGAANDDSTAPPPESVHQKKPEALRSMSLPRPRAFPLPAPLRLPLPLVLPAPPDAMPSTVPPPPPPRQMRSRTALAVAEPLVLYYGDQALVIDHHPYVIGRSANVADLVIDDGEVSRRHAVLEHTAGGWMITDLGSTNGIIVDGQAVAHAVLRAGVVMSIGPMTFRVASPG